MLSILWESALSQKMNMHHHPLETLQSHWFTDHYFHLRAVSCSKIPVRTFFSWNTTTQEQHLWNFHQLSFRSPLIKGEKSSFLQWRTSGRYLKMTLKALIFPWKLFIWWGKKIIFSRLEDFWEDLLCIYQYIRNGLCSYRAWACPQSAVPFPMCCFISHHW